MRDVNDALEDTLQTLEYVRNCLEAGVPIVFDDDDDIAFARARYIHKSARRAEVRKELAKRAQQQVDAMTKVGAA